MIEHPKDWVQGSYYFTNTNHRDIEVWTANGVSGCQLQGHSGLTLFERIYLLRCVAQSKANKLYSDTDTKKFSPLK